jgi:SAM-dependent methyltransferase
MRVTAIEGHRTWAAGYDAGPNPLLALETRLLVERLSPLRASRFLDVACGTGRWMLWARQSGARVFGIDFCPEMLAEASRKPCLAGCLSLGDACRIPVADGAAGLTISSFALGYLPSPHPAIAEMARVTRTGGRIILSDLHPSALEAGWTRSFRSGGQVYEIDHHCHSIASCEAAAESCGLTLDWRLEASFAEPEREIFRRAGKDSLFPELSRIPALFALCWIRT